MLGPRLGGEGIGGCATGKVELLDYDLGRVVWLRVRPREAGGPLSASVEWSLPRAVVVAQAPPPRGTISHRA